MKPSDRIYELTEAALPNFYTGEQRQQARWAALLQCLDEQHAAGCSVAEAEPMHNHTMYYAPPSPCPACIAQGIVFTESQEPKSSESKP